MSNSIREYGDKAAAQLAADYEKMTPEQIAVHAVEVARMAAMLGENVKVLHRALAATTATGETYHKFLTRVLEVINLASEMKRAGRKREAWELLSSLVGVETPEALEPISEYPLYDLDQDWQAFFHPLDAPEPPQLELVKW